MHGNANTLLIFLFLKINHKKKESFKFVRLQENK